MIVQFDSNTSALKAMQQDFREYWLAQPIVTEIAWEEVTEDFLNGPLKVTADKTVYEGEGFVEVAIRQLEGAQVAMGVSKFENRGTITVSVFGEGGRGVSRGTGQLVEQVLKYFQDVRTHRAAYWNAVARPIGRAGRWYRINVTAEYLYQYKR